MPAWPVVEDPYNHQRLRDLEAQVERLREGGTMSEQYGEGKNWRDSATRALDAMHKRATKAEAEVAWRKQAMIDARDCLACGDGEGAYRALDRHHEKAALGSKTPRDPAERTR